MDNRACRVVNHARAHAVHADQCRSTKPLANFGQASAFPFTAYFQTLRIFRRPVRIHLTSMASVVATGISTARSGTHLCHNFHKAVCVNRHRANREQRFQEPTEHLGHVPYRGRGRFCQRRRIGRMTEKVRNIDGHLHLHVLFRRSGQKKRLKRFSRRLGAFKASGTSISSSSVSISDSASFRSPDPKGRPGGMAPEPVCRHHYLFWTCLDTVIMAHVGHAL